MYNNINVTINLKIIINETNILIHFCGEIIYREYIYIYFYNIFYVIL